MQRVDRLQKSFKIINRFQQLKNLQKKQNENLQKIYYQQNTFLIRNQILYNQINKMNLIPQYSFAKVGKKKQQKMEKETQKKELSETLDKKIDLNITEDQFKKEIQDLKDQLKKLQVGRLTPSSFDRFQISAYGEKQKISELAQIQPKNETTVILNVFDESLVQAIYKTLENTGEQFQLKREGKNIQVVLHGGNTKETKQNTIKEAQSLGLKQKTKLKNVRHKAIDGLKPYKKVSSADVIKNAETEIQNMYQDFVKQIDDLLKKKENEIMKA